MLEGQPGYDVAVAESYRATGPKPRILVETGANPGRQGVRLGSTRLSELRWAQAASAAFHNSGPRSFPAAQLARLVLSFF